MICTYHESFHCCMIFSDQVPYIKFRFHFKNEIFGWRWRYLSIWKFVWWIVFLLDRSVRVILEIELYSQIAYTMHLEIWNWNRFWFFDRISCHRYQIVAVVSPRLLQVVCLGFCWIQRGYFCLKCLRVVLCVLNDWCRSKWMMTKQWFKHENVSNHFEEIRRLLLVLRNWQ